MLVSITTTHRPATDLGYLLHKHPDNVRTVSFPFGDAHVFFPVADEDRCTATLLIEIDPVDLVRRKGQRNDAFSLSGYINDRPYVASSFTSVALAKLFGTAMGGRCESHPELAASPIPLTVEIPTLPCHGGEDLLRRIFEPLGYQVTADPVPLDPEIPDWGDSRYLSVRLDAEVRLADLLAHLYVAIPVLDDAKHYWINQGEIDKLMAKGEGWLSDHPERDLIVDRYLKRRRPLTADAIERLTSDDGEEPDPPARRESLAAQRTAAVVAELKAVGARRVIDLGCGEGHLLAALVSDADFDEIVGVDVSMRELGRAARRLRLDDMSPRQRSRIELIQSGITYRDRRLADFDAAAVVEVIEHLDADRLDAFEQSLFRHARPRAVVLTTPNRDHNVRYEGLAAGELRHPDHRFEWDRDELAAWAGAVADRHGYRVRFGGIGTDDPEVGPPTQMAVFER